MTRSNLRQAKYLHQHIQISWSHKLQPFQNVTVSANSRVLVIPPSHPPSCFGTASDTWLASTAAVASAKVKNRPSARVSAPCNASGACESVFTANSTCSGPGNCPREALGAAKPLRWEERLSNNDGPLDDNNLCFDDKRDTMTHGLEHTCPSMVDRDGKHECIVKVAILPSLPFPSLYPSSCPMQIQEVARVWTPNERNLPLA